MAKFAHPGKEGGGFSERHLLLFFLFPLILYTFPSFVFPVQVSTLGCAPLHPFRSISAIWRENDVTLDWVLTVWSFFLGGGLKKSLFIYLFLQESMIVIKKMFAKSLRRSLSAEVIVLGPKMTIR